MSYEGFEQFLCKNGHYYTVDAYGDKPKECYTCGAKFVWWNAVDQTNGSYEYDECGNEVQIDGYIELLLEKEQEYCVCSCGYKHLKSAPVYKIPEVGGHKC